MNITSHIGVHIRRKSASNHIDYQKENREDFACRPLALPIYSLDLIASVDFFYLFSLDVSIVY
jgi:hypothetical protein